MTGFPMRAVPREHAPQVRFHDFAPAQQSFRDALLEGLSAPEKSIPCRFLYDAVGSALFERICELPEYYPTRVEMGILERVAGEIADRVGPRCRLIEFGSGSSAKVRILLRRLHRPGCYVPIDISRDHLLASAEALAEEEPDLPVVAICADYGQRFFMPLLPGSGRRFGFFPGSTIGNLRPAAAVEFLALCRTLLGQCGAMLVGVDTRKDAGVLHAAYDDAAGVTAEFTLNVLARANRELGADFDLDGFAHEANYDPATGRVAIHLRSLTRQSATAAGRRFFFAAGECLHVEDSFKYAPEEFAALAERAGFRAEACWTDAAGMFSVHYLAVGQAAA